MTKQQCPLCGAFDQEYKIKPMTYNYKNVAFVIKQPALWCDSCGEGIIDAKASNEVMPLIQAEKARIDGLLTPEEIREVRIKLKLTQKKSGCTIRWGYKRIQ